MKEAKKLRKRTNSCFNKLRREYWWTDWENFLLDWFKASISNNDSKYWKKNHAQLKFLISRFLFLFVDWMSRSLQVRLKRYVFEFIVRHLLNVARIVESFSHLLSCCNIIATCHYQYTCDLRKTLILLECV